MIEECNFVNYFPGFVEGFEDDPCRVCGKIHKKRPNSENKITLMNEGHVAGFTKTHEEAEEICKKMKWVIYED